MCWGPGTAGGVLEPAPTSPESTIVTFSGILQSSSCGTVACSQPPARRNLACSFTERFPSTPGCKGRGGPCRQTQGSLCMLKDPADKSSARGGGNTGTSSCTLWSLKASDELCTPLPDHFTADSAFPCLPLPSCLLPQGRWGGQKTRPSSLASVSSAPLSQGSGLRDGGEGWARNPSSRVPCAQRQSYSCVSKVGIEALFCAPYE